MDGVRVSADIEIEIDEGAPISIGKSVICLGEKCLEKVQAVQDSMDLPKKPVEKDKELLKARPFTFQKNMELMYNILCQDLFTKKYTLKRIFYYFEMLFSPEHLNIISNNSLANYYTSTKNTQKTL